MWDDSAHGADFSLSYETTIDNYDVFSGALDVHALVGQNQLDLSTLKATAYCDPPNGGSRFWESDTLGYPGGADHPVFQQALNRTNPMDPNDTSQAAAYNSTTSTYSTSLSSGTLSATLFTIGDDDDGDSFHHAYTNQVQFTPATNGAFASSTHLQAVLTPDIFSKSARGNGGSVTAQTTKTFTDWNDQIVVALTEQSDGSFAASAPSGQTFAETPEENEGVHTFTNVIQLVSYHVAVVDTDSNTWDSNGGANYVLNLSN